MFLAPLFCLLFLTTLMSQGLPSSLPLAVVDLDNTKTTRSLINNIDAFEQSHVVMRTADFSEARRAMQRREVYGILFIPEHFSEQAASGKQPQLVYYTNNNYMMGGSLLFKDLKMLSELASGYVSLQVRQAKGQEMGTIMGKIQPIQVEQNIIGNPWLNYSIYLNNMLIPGILQLLILQLTVYSIGVEIKNATAREWLRIAGGSIVTALVGKLLVHTIIWFLVGTCCLSVIYGFFHFPLNSGWFPMLFALLLLILAAQALGIVFISLLPTLRFGLSLASLFGMLSFSITGFSFPVSAMYPPIQALSYLFPLRHYFLIYADQALNGYPLTTSWVPYLCLLLLSMLPFLFVRDLRKSLLSVRYMM